MMNWYFTKTDKTVLVRNFTKNKGRIVFTEKAGVETKLESHGKGEKNQFEMINRDECGKLYKK
jgi:hypothetical protein